MGWTGGQFEGPLTSRAAIAFELGEGFAGRVIDTARYGNVIYAAVRSADGREVFGLVLLTQRREGTLYTKAISEDMGPAEDYCPARILDLLTGPPNEHAREWRERCRARLARGRSRRNQSVVFAERDSWTPVEHDEGVFYLESEAERIGPYSRAEAQAEAARLNAKNDDGRGRRSR